MELSVSDDFRYDSLPKKYSTGSIFNQLQNSTKNCRKDLSVVLGRGQYRPR